MTSTHNFKTIEGIDTGISSIGMGCWAIGGPFSANGAAAGWGDVDDNVSLRALAAAIDAGVTLFDTADVYGTGHSEQVLGQALAAKRDELVIATKFGNRFDADARALTGEDVTPKYMELALEQSLKRLNTDYVDLYQLHVNAATTAQVDELALSLEKLVAAGKIRKWGWSTDFLEPVQGLKPSNNFAAVQLAFNLFDGNQDLLEHAQNNGLLALIRSPLAMGLLTGKFSSESRIQKDDIRAAAHPWMTYFQSGAPNPAMLKKLDAVKELLRSDGRTLVQGSLCWLMAKSPAAVPIPGFKSEKQVLENAGAMQFGPLSASIMQEIDALLAA